MEKGLMIVAMHAINEVGEAKADGLTLERAARVYACLRRSVKALNDAYDIASRAETGTKAFEDFSNDTL